MMNEVYVAKVTIRTAKRSYRPGDTVDGISETDLAYLIEKGFVKKVANKKEELPDSKPDPKPDPNDGGKSNPPDQSDDIPEFYTEKELNKLPNKKSIVEYAESIGLSGLNKEIHRTELIDKVLAYIAEVQEA